MMKVYPFLRFFCFYNVTLNMGVRSQGYYLFIRTFKKGIKNLSGHFLFLYAKRGRQHRQLTILLLFVEVSIGKDQVPVQEPTIKVFIMMSLLQLGFFYILGRKQS